MKIAWQYKNYLGDDAEGLSPSKTPPWCHSFDINRNIEASKLDTARIQKHSSNLASLASFSAKLHSVYADVNKIVNDMNTYAIDFMVFKRIVFSYLFVLGLGSPES
jgi:hypothetical protein